MLLHDDIFLNEGTEMVVGVGDGYGGVLFIVKWFNSIFGKWSQTLVKTMNHCVTFNS